MRSHAKAAPAGSTTGRGRAGLLAAGLIAIGLLVLAPLSQAKVLVSGFGTSGSSDSPRIGGQIGNPNGVAVNSTGAGGVAKGTVYVVDGNLATGSPERLQRFAPAGDFERLWGENVLGRDERQRISFAGATGGTFKLFFGPDSAEFAMGSSAATVQAALEAMPSIGVGNVVVGSPGGDLTVRFVGALGGTDVPQIAVDGSQLSGTPPISASASTLEQGSGGPFAGFEVCTVAVQCKEGLGTFTQIGFAGLGKTSANGGQLGQPSGVAVDQSSGHVYVTETGNRRVSEFDADGNFVRAWGWDVVLSGKPGDVPGTSEKQTVTLGASTGGKFRLEFSGQVTGAGGTATTTASSNVLRDVTTSSGRWAVGQVLTGTGIPTAGATITAVDFAAGTLTLSAPATSNGTNRSIVGHDIPWNASPALLQAELEALPTIGAGNVSVTSANPGGGAPAGGPYTVTFQGALADADVAQIVASGTGLTGPKTVTIATTVPGKVGGYEICEAAADCKAAAAAGSDGGRFAASNGLANALGNPVIDSAGDVWVPEPVNSRIQRFDSSGSFLAAYGHGVVDSGATGTGTVTNGSKSITAAVTTSRAFAVGQEITATGIPAGTTITALSNAKIDISQAATAAATGAGTVLTVAPGAGNNPGNEEQTVALGANTTGGTFTLSFALTAPDSTTPQTTAPIAFNASAATLQAALEALSNIAPGDIAVSGPAGGPWAIAFGGTRFADTNVAQMTSSPTGLAVSSGSPSVAVETPRDGGALETCTSTAAAVCRAGVAGKGLGQFAIGSPQRIAFDAAGNLYAIDAGNKRVLKFNPALTTASVFGAATFAAFTTNAPNQVLATQGGNRLVFALSGTALENPKLIELDPADASLEDTSLAGADLAGAFNGLAVNTESGDIYATTSSTKSPRRVLVLSSTAPPAPVPALDPVTVKTDTTATFSGSVDPKGGWVECRFQHSTDQATWTDVAAPDCEELSTGAGAQAISQEVGGLSANTQYFVRLAVSRPLDPGSLKTTLPKAFSTEHVAPIVSNVDAVEVGDTSARLVGTVNPNKSATAYVFEYGTSPALGSSTDPVSIGSGSAPLIVSQVIDGLSPATTYYFRLRATNLAGSASNVTKTLTTRANPVPAAEARRFEQVSPADKNLGTVDNTPFPTSSAAPDGQAVGFCTGSGLPEDQVAGPCANYVSRRGEAGWRTVSLNPRICSSGNIFQGMKSFPSRNFDSAIFLMPLQSAYCPAEPLDPNQPAGSGAVNSVALYRESLLEDPVSYELISPTALTDQGFSASTSDDAGHVVFPDVGQHTPDAPAGAFSKLYDWHEGSLALVSKSPAGAPLTADAAVPENAVNGVSAGGERIFFQSPAGNTIDCGSSNCELYLREGAAQTTWVSEEECTATCPNDGTRDVFEWASLDGSRALFRTTAKLLDADTQPGSDLYLYSHSANPASDQNLRLVSVDSEPADGSVADILGVIGIADDAETVYFAANGQLVLNGPTAAGPKLYRWRLNGGSPTLDYLGSLAAGEAKPPWVSTTLSYPSMRLVAPDGEHLLVQVATRLDPVADQDTGRDVYRWSEAGGWTCVSCQAPGTASSGHASIEGTAFEASLPHPGLVNREQRLVMSDDGERVFFTTPDALADGDLNGTVPDVYEWHDGALTLISGGGGPKEALLVGVSRSGADVLFITHERLVGWDTDGGSDIYDARIGGGFPEPPPGGAAPCGSADSCLGPVAPAPPPTGAGTAAFEAPGDSGGEGRCGGISQRARRLKARARKASGRKAQRLRKQANSLATRAGRCNRRQAR
ncbi:MAG TPA: hypothetical protein VFY04_03590 [Solirubrobacterales bacterium]|nr:hypothetical protein [Solirubrobacterales bacterium]